MRSLIRLSLILAVSAVLGAVTARVHGVSWIADEQAVRERWAAKAQQKDRFAELRATVGITLDELRQYIAGGAVIIDARDRESFERQHLRIDYEPPVLNVPPESTLDEHLPRLLELRGYPLVLYCTSLTCDLAEELYLRLEQAGLLTEFADVRIYFPGWEGIEQSDLPKTSGADTWTGFGFDQFDGLEDMDGYEQPHDDYAEFDDEPLNPEP